MPPSSYEKQVAKIQSSFNRLKEACNLLRDYVQPTIDLNALQVRINALAERTFKVAVCGPVKVGKSSFINGLLADLILPTSAIPCTAAVVEVYHSSTAQLEVELASRTLASRNRRIIDDPNTPENEIRSALINYAAVDEKYSCLPLYQINQYLKCRTPGPLDHAEWRERYRSHGWHNPHKLPADEFECRIQDYIIENHDLSKIAESIRLGVPLRNTWRNVRIWDTPGINDIAGIGGLTVDSLDLADVIIFVLSGDSLAFDGNLSFLSKIIESDRNRNNIFVIYNDKSNGTQNHRATIGQIKKTIQGRIPEENFFIVDSLFRMLEFLVEQGNDDDRIMKSCIELGMAELPPKYRLLKMENNNQKNLLEKLHKEAGYEPLETRLGHYFSEHVARESLQQTGELVHKVWKQVTEEAKRQLNIYKQVASGKRPQIFYAEICRFEEKRETIEKLLIDIEDAKESYVADTQIDIDKAMNLTAQDAISKIAKSKTPEQAVAEAEQFKIDISKKSEDLRSRFVKKSHEMLEHLEHEFKQQTKCSPPPVNLSHIESKAQTAALKKNISRVPRIPSYSLWAVIGTGVGAAIGSIVPVVGTAIGAGIGAAVVGVIGGESTHRGAGKHDVVDKKQYLVAIKSGLADVVSQSTEQMVQYLKDARHEYFSQLAEEFRRNLESIEVREKNTLNILREHHRILPAIKVLEGLQIEFVLDLTNDVQ